MPGTDVLHASQGNPKVLASLRLADTNADAAYTAPSTGSAVIKHGVLCNVSGGTVNVSVAVSKAGQVPDDGTHWLVSAYPLAAGDSLTLTDYLKDACLGPGDEVSVKASAANAINVVLSGIEYT